MSQASWLTLFAYCWCNERFKFLKKLKDNFLHLLINKRFGQRLKSVNITDTPTIMTSQCQRITPFLLHHHHQQAAGGEVAVVAPLAMWGTENGTAHAQLVLYGCTYIIPTSDVWKGSNHLKCYLPLLPLRERYPSQSLRVPNCHIVLFFIWHTCCVLCIEKKIIFKYLVLYNIPKCP